MFLAARARDFANERVAIGANDLRNSIRLRLIIVFLQKGKVSFHFLLGCFLNVPEVVVIVGVAGGVSCRYDDAELFVDLAEGVFVNEIADFAFVMPALLADQPGLPVAIWHFDPEAQLFLVLFGI